MSGKNVIMDFHEIVFYIVSDGLKLDIITGKTTVRYYAA